MELLGKVDTWYDCRAAELERRAVRGETGRRVDEGRWLERNETDGREYQLWKFKKGERTCEDVKLLNYDSDSSEDAHASRLPKVAQQ